jgi:O-antigen/teichoic acid export membrane protein
VSRHRAEVVFGVRLARHLSIYVLGSLLVLIVSFVQVAVLTRLMDKSEYGQLSLVIFFAALTLLIFNLGLMQGTMRVVFGAVGDDDADMDEDQADVDPEEVRPAMGTGLVMTAAVATLGTLLVWAFSGQLAEWLLGDSSRANLVVLASLAGAFGALLHLTTNVLRYERRPVSWVVASVARPVLILAPSIILVSAGKGVTGAAEGLVIGTGVTFLLLLVVTRHNYQLTFRPEIAKEIIRKGSLVIPIILSLWIVQNVDTFILSRYVPHHTLAPYRVAGQYGIAVSFSIAAFFRAWQPLRRTTSFEALTSRYGEDAMRGVMVTYFVLMALALLTGLTVASHTFAKVAPNGYTSLDYLIPLVAAGYFCHGALALVYRTSKFPRKRSSYAMSSLLAAGVFTASAIFLAPLWGSTGAALAVVAGFLAGMLVLWAISQRSERPIPIDYKRLGGAFAFAGIAIVLGRLAAEAVPPGLAQLAIGAAATLLFAGLCLATGVVPRGHRAPLTQVVQSLARIRSGDMDAEAALAGLAPDDREVLRLAVVHRYTPEQIAESTDRDLNDVQLHLVSALRQLRDQTEATEHDRRIGHYLFYRSGSVAQRDAVRGHLWTAGAEPNDVRDLEATLEVLDKAPRHAWHPDGEGAEEETNGASGERKRRWLSTRS